MFVIDVLQGLAPGVVFAASAVLIDRAPNVAASADARRAVVLALGVIAVVLVVERTTQATALMLTNLVQFQTEAAVDRLRMHAASALPGLAHFDTPAMADKLEAASWAVSAGQLGNTVGHLVQLAAMMVGTGIVGSRIAWWAPLVVVAASVPFMALSWCRSSWLGQLRMGQLGTQRTGAYYASLALGTSPAREVRIFGLDRWLVQRHAEHWQRAAKPMFEAERKMLRRNLILTVPRIAITSIPFWVGANKLLAHQLGLGLFASAVMSLVFMGSELPGIEQMIGYLREGTQFLPNLWRLVDLPRTDPRLTLSGARRVPRRLGSGIRFEGVRFAYAGADAPVLDDLDLFIRAGSRLALVGENGAGKSTLVKLLSRMYDPQCGRITIDGVDLRDFDIADLRHHLAVFIQDLTPFPFTVRENIALGAVECAADDDRIAAAAAATGADVVISSLPGGWNALLSKEFGGIDLSGGEWQRVSLARTVMARFSRRAPIVILDEPAATLDVRLEHELHKRMESVSAGATTLLISHRLSTVRTCDSVAVLAAGKICEMGTHDELMRTGGLYERLYRLQASPFRAEGRTR